VQAEHSSATVLTDGVVTLRPWREEDVPAIVKACSDPETALWLDQLPHPYTADDARAWLADETDAARFAVELEGEIAGSISVRFDVWQEGAADVGYWTSPGARGNGVATRALVLVARWALGHPRVARLQIRADVENVASCRVAERAGFRREGTIRAARFNERRGRRVDFALYSLLPGELG